MFRTERDCFEFVVRSRWPEDDFKCPSCGSSDTYTPKNRLAIICATCKHIQSATAGTVMHGSRLPLSSWLLAAWLLVTDKRGISAKHLERTIGVSYETAYMMLQRLRAAMVNPQRDRLRGEVEVDESLIGGVKHGRRGKGTIGGKGGKFIAIGAVEIRRGTSSKTGEIVTRPGRLRLRHGENLSGETLLRFVAKDIEPGTMVVTDGLKEYEPLPRMGYQHRIESTALGFPQKEVLKHLHLAFANLKTWMAGTFHGRVEGKHLQGYLNEFCFRFNRRDNLVAAFQTILSIAPKIKAPTYSEVYTKKTGRV